MDKQNDRRDEETYRRSVERHTSGGLEISRGVEETGMGSVVI